MGVWGCENPGSHVSTPGWILPVPPDSATVCNAFHVVLHRENGDKEDAASRIAVKKAARYGCQRT